LHSGVRIAAAALICAAVVAAGLVLVSGDSDSDPRTPAALAGHPPPFLGTAVSGDGGLTAAVDAYGDIVDLRAPGPVGAALIDNPSARQAAGTVPADTGIVPRIRVGGGPAEPLWRAESVAQRYLSGTNVVRTVARFPGANVVVTTAAVGERLAVVIHTKGRTGRSATPSVSVNTQGGLRCAREGRGAQLDLNCQLGRVVPPVPGAAAREAIRSAIREAHRWLARSRPLGGASATEGGGRIGPADATQASPALGPPPSWARSMYERSLLTIHALTSSRTGAVAAGARDGWAYVWPRDAATAALALASSGHQAEARQVAKFLTGLDLNAAARFTESGTPVPGRAAQGDAAGWVTVAAQATGVPAPTTPYPWRDRADYQESTPGTYLGNALAATAVTNPQHHPVDGPKTQGGVEFSAHQQGGAAEGGRIGREFGAEGGLVRVAGDPGSGLDSAAGWAVRPFGLAALYGRAERTLLALLGEGTRYGITPGEGWEGGEDPWMAPTAWSAWALAGLAAEARRDGSPSEAATDRRAALRLMADLRRAATPAGALPERVDARTGVPTSTTPLLWSSAFAVLALRELWP
jgi:glucoamylase